MVSIAVAVTEFDGLRMGVSYRVTDANDGVLRCTGQSRHCFVNEKGRPVSLKKVSPKYDAVFRQALEQTHRDAVV
jgi:acyl-CoA thioester hydrolase